MYPPLHTEKQNEGSQNQKGQGSNGIQRGQRKEKAKETMEAQTGEKKVSQSLKNIKKKGGEEPTTW